jgi:outer membrane lipoprotein-sorting protein
MKVIMRGSTVILVSIIMLGTLACLGFEGNARADDENELFAAIESRNSEALKEVLSRGVNIEARAPNNCTPLMFAAASNNAEAAKILLENGAEVDAKGFTSRDGTANSTALILAAETGSSEVAELLIEKGADVNYINSFNRTALFWAYKANKPEMIKLLESKGATKEGKASDGANSGDTDVKNAKSQTEGASKTAPKDSGNAAAKSAIESGFENAASTARLKACFSNMKMIEGACELFLMENGAPKDQLTIAGLIEKNCLKTEPQCPLSKKNTYLINIKGYDTTIKCTGHNKTLAEMVKTVGEIKNAGKLPDAGNASAAAKQPAPDAKKSAALKTFMEVFNKCTHDASVTVQTTLNKTTPPDKITQYFYYRDPSNFRSDTHSAGQKVRMVISGAGSWYYSENDAKLTPIPPEKAAEISYAMNIGAIVSDNIDLFEVKESKDKNNNILIYILNKNTGFMSTYVIDGKLKAFKRLCTYPKKGLLSEDCIYSNYKFGKIDDKAFTVPKPAKTGVAK